jgi:hypothetical protein
MAYVSQERKAKLSVGIKEVLKKYSVRGTIAVSNHSTLVVNLQSGAIDFLSDYIGERSRDGYFQISGSWYQKVFTGKAREFLGELYAAMNGKGTGDQNFDNSDSMTDYFHVGWYTNINIGKWDRPYQVTD